MIVYAKYIKHKCNVGPTITKYWELVSSRVDNRVRKFGKIIDSYKLSPRRLCSNNILFLHTILEELFNIFIVSQQQINTFIFLKNNI